MFFKYKGEELVLRYPRYGNGKLAIQLDAIDGPYCRVSVNTDHILDSNEFVVSHNCPADVVRMLLDSSYFEDTGDVADYGFVKGQPILRMIHVH